MKIRALAIIACLLPACVDSAVDDATDCTDTGCAAGEVCDPISGLCEASCVEAGCEDGTWCDETTELCAASCVDSGGCDGERVCDADSGACLVSCVDTGCDNAAWCDPDSGLCETEIVIPDANLDLCVRLYLNIREGALTVTDAAGLTYLDCSDRNIADLTGLEHFVNLVDLTLWENQITAVHQLGSLTQLTSLQLGHNAITNIYYVGELTQLEHLGLAHNEIFNLSPLSGLKLLTWLNLDGNDIDDVSPLLELDNLAWLTLEDNPIVGTADLDALETAGVEIYKQNSGGSIDISALDPKLRVDVDASRRDARLTHWVAPDGEVRFYYEQNGIELPVFSEYPGRLYAQAGELRYAVAGRDLAIGAVDGDDFYLCQGPYAGLCEFRLGRKNPVGLENGHQLVGAGVPIITANLRVELDSPRFMVSEYVYGERFRWLEPYLLASPNQLDAGSCNYMANTGAMEILMNQHVPLNEIEHDGDTDLSERYLMNASGMAPSSVVDYHITDVIYTFNHFAGGLLSRDYPFAAGYVREAAGGNLVAARSDEPGAYFSASYSWIEDMPVGWQEMLAETPEATRTLVFVDPDLDSQSIWNVGIMNDDVIERIKHELLTKHAPVLVVYNHYLYWHNTIVVGYDDNAYAGSCPMVQSSMAYFEEQGHTYAKTKIEQAMDREGGCSEYGVFYVRDSIYDGDSDDGIFTYGGGYDYEDAYSAPLVEHSYDWAKYLGNHAYSIHRR